MKHARTMLSVAGLSLLLSAAPASADIIFELGNNPQPDEENILFQGGEQGNTITGFTQTNVGVQFTSTQNLCQNAQGQASIFTSPTCGSNPQDDGLITNLNISAPGYTFLDFIMNPLNGSGTATITVTDNFLHQFSYDLGNGQNFLTIFAVNGQSIENIAISVTGDASAGFDTFKQPRISGLCSNAVECPGGPQQVPEPGPLALLGAALVAGLLSRRKNSRNA
jgi:hypothetical protein